MPSLANPVNDANDMAAVLKSLGFEVILKVNASKRTMKNNRDYLRRATFAEWRCGIVLLFGAWIAIQQPQLFGATRGGYPRQCGY